MKMNDEWSDYANLYIYYLKSNSTNPAKDTVFHGKKLGDWINKQIRDFENNRLSTERKMILYGINNKWYVANNKHNNAWMKNYKKLLRWLEDDPALLNISSDIELSNWLNGQRSKFRDNTLKYYRKEYLDEAYVYWHVSDGDYRENKYLENKSKTEGRIVLSHLNILDSDEIEELHKYKIISYDDIINYKCRGIKNDTKTKIVRHINKSDKIRFGTLELLEVLFGIDIEEIIKVLGDLDAVEEQIVREINRLPKLEKRFVNRRHYSEYGRLTVGEITKEFSCSRDKIARTLSRAYKTMRSRIRLEDLSTNN